jgi:hypothetical protein
VGCSVNCFGAIIYSNIQRKKKSIRKEKMGKEEEKEIEGGNHKFMQDTFD